MLANAARRPAAQVLRAAVARRALASAAAEQADKQTALYDFHVSKGGKMVPFAGWAMPLSYPDQSHIQSHMHVRAKAGLFDVSHMLQTRWEGKDALDFMESLVVGDIKGLAPGASTLSLFTTEQGGILDDTVIQRAGEHELYVVSNAGCADKDLAHIRHHLAQWQAKGKDVNVTVLEDKALLALQGPRAIAALETLTPAPLDSLKFMHGASMTLKGGIQAHVTRCGYTGEDGVEISVPSSQAVQLAESLLAHEDVALAGLGARDSLRLEAGLCLYGHDMDESVTPVEASLLWTIAKRRRAEANFLGAEAILAHAAKGAPITKRRVGLVVKGAPAREGAVVVDLASGDEIGKVTSGVPSPVLKKNVAMAYVKGGFHKQGTEVGVVVRGKTMKATVEKMPFVPHNYFRG